MRTDGWYDNRNCVPRRRRIRRSRETGNCGIGASELPPDRLGEFYELTQGGVTWNVVTARALASLLLEGYQGDDDLPAATVHGPTVDDLVGSWQATHKDLRAGPRKGPATIVQGTQSGQPMAAPFLGLPTPREIVPHCSRYGE